MSQDPFSAPARGCAPCRSGDHFGCWEDNDPESFTYRDALEHAPHYSCECAEKEHPS